MAKTERINNFVRDVIPMFLASAIVYAGSEIVFGGHVDRILASIMIYLVQLLDVVSTKKLLDGGGKELNPTINNVQKENFLRKALPRDVIGMIYFILLPQFAPAFITYKLLAGIHNVRELRKPD